MGYPLTRLRTIRLWLKNVVMAIVVLAVLIAQYIEGLQGTATCSIFVMHQLEEA